MKFKDRLLQGTLIKRYKRFFVDVAFKNKVITAHCPNSGSMMGLLNKGNSVWFSEASNPKRKLKYTLEIVNVDKKLVGINTQLTNKIVLEALNQKKIKDLIKFIDIKSEVKFSEFFIIVKYPPNLTTILLISSIMLSLEVKIPL